MGMKLAALTAEPEKKDARINTCFVDMIQTSRPGGVCPEACLHCGAFDAESGGRQVQLTREELKANLEREIPAIRDDTRGKTAAAYLAPFVTTDVDVEPTNGDAFYDAAELVYELTGGASKMLCISHGIRSHVKPVNPRDGTVVNQIFSLFDTFNLYSYSPESWKVCMERIETSSLPDEIKECIYRAFVNKLKLLSGDKEDPTTSAFDALVEIDFEDGFANKLLTYLEARQISSNQLMLDRTNVTDVFVGNGILAPVKGNLESNASASRLKKIVELIRRGIVPGFILTVDFARSKGKISMETNLYSYIKTLELLRPILAADSPGFLAVSIQGLQGDDVPEDHPYSAIRAHIFFQEVLERSNLTEAEKRKIKYDTGRNYVKAGRVVEDPLLKDFVSDDDACEVIPYQEFVDKVVSRQRKLFRARLRADGGIEKQYVESGRTYNTTVKGPWEQLIDAPSIREFTRDGAARALSGEIGTDALLTPKERTRKAKISWEQEVEKDSDIFLIKPFSALHRGDDRRRALTLIKRVLGVRNISQYMVTIERGERRKIRFEDFKMVLLRALRPGANIGDLITEASPYKDTLHRISSTGEAVGAVLGEQSYYAGEIMALAQALDEQLSVDYLVSDLDAIYAKRIEAPRDDDDENGGGGNTGENGGSVGGEGENTGGADGKSCEGGGSGGALGGGARSALRRVSRTDLNIAGGPQALRTGKVPVYREDSSSFSG